MIGLSEVALKTGLPSNFIKKLAQEGVLDTVKQDDITSYKEEVYQTLVDYMDDDKNEALVDTIRDLDGLDFMFEKSNNEPIQKIYYNIDRNIMLVLLSSTEQSEETDIYNGLSKEYFTHLVNTLNTNQDMVVIWEKNETALSSYTIFHTVDAGEYTGNEAKDILAELFKNVKEADGEDFQESKYGEVKNKVWTKIKLK
jgi:hypothetical protein